MERTGPALASVLSVESARSKRQPGLEQDGDLTGQQPDIPAAMIRPPRRITTRRDTATAVTPFLGANRDRALPAQPIDHGSLIRRLQLAFDHLAGGCHRLVGKPGHAV